MQKLMLSPDEGAEVIGVKRSTMFNLLRSGKIKSIKIGRLRRVRVEELEAFLARQAAEQSGEGAGERGGSMVMTG